MQAVRRIVRTVVFMGASLLVVFASPIIVLADDPTTVPSTSAPVPSTTTPPTTTDPAPTTTAPTTSPTSTATTTTPTTSAPVTPSTSPAPTTNSSPSTASAPAPPKTTYTYDSATGHWNTNSWVYDPVSGTYQAVVTPIPTPPASVSQAANPSSTGGGTGSQTAVSDATTAAIANALNSTAGTGAASVLNNTAGGNATSGNASAAATIVNNVNSSLTSASNKQAASFVSNVMGDVNGDIMLQPMLLKAMLEAGAQTPTGTNSINNVTSNAASNNVTLAANSGNATVAGNTSAGNATTGSANTVADVVNIVNSMVAANQSFIGTINIYGNLNGDILIAPDFIPKLLASNVAAPSTTSAAPTTVNATDTQSIVNNISLAAKSGQALVTGNTSAGNATTGNAATNTVIFNLTGHQIVASNSLLVFVNVLGHWVGVIVDAPSGATAAALGSGVTTDSVTPNLVINSANTTQLTNNINLASQSGDATVSHNTSAGNAQSGNATASANVANISNSQIGLSGWFGVLFINVFGNWIGSFGVDTAAGEPPVIPMPQGAGQLTKSANGSPVLPVMAFLPHSPRHASAAIVQGGVVTPPSGSSTTTDQPTSDSSSAPAGSGNTASPQSTVHTPLISIPAFNLPLLIGSTLLTGVSLFGIRKLS